MSEGHQASLRSRLGRGETVIGTWLWAAAPSVIDVIGFSNLDFVVLDSEHLPIDESHAEHLLRTADLAHVSSLVRVGSNSRNEISRRLDMGAGGVIVPHVDTVEDARAVVRYSRFSPDGARGMGGGRATGYIKPFDAETLRRMDDDILVVAEIESSSALQSLPEILKVPGIDVFIFGRQDLSQELGMPGDVLAESIVAPVTEGVERVVAAGKVAGMHADSAEEAQMWLSAGVRFLTYRIDLAFLADGIAVGMSHLRLDGHSDGA